MKKRLLLLLFVIQTLLAFGQSADYWQQQVDYTISVSLNPGSRSLEGNLEMLYTNHAPDTLHFLWIELYPNAYKNDKTAFTDQQLENGSTAFYFSEDNQRGYINRLNFKVDGMAASTLDHPVHQDIIKLLLPQPLAPGKQCHIETPFNVKLPLAFSRSGVIGNSYQITQWYPKPAVYDKHGWHEIPYLDQGEFYSEFGNYKVSITTPDSFLVAATGNLKNTSKQPNSITRYYEQNKVHDFAWFASPDFLIKEDTLQLASHTVKLNAFYYPKNEKIWAHSIAMMKDAVRTKSKWLGEYPYDAVTVVDKKGMNDGGMEYPTITLVSTPGTEKELDFVINHEIGHNWFYGILASNERLHPWMDEGINTYYDKRYIAEKYGSAPMAYSETSSAFLNKRLPGDFMELGMHTMIDLKKDQPIETPASKFSVMNYGLMAYTKAGNWLKTIEQKLGKDVFDKSMQAYYENWKFKHPSPADFKNSLEQSSGRNLDASFALLQQKGELEPQARQKKKIKFSSFFNLKETDKYNYINILPAVGYNYYDGLMLGAMLHNYSLPFPKFKFFIAPLFGTGSKVLDGIGRAGYTFLPGTKGAKFEIALAGEKFTGDNFIDSTGKKNNQSFSKLVPTLRYEFAKINPRSSISRVIQWKTFLINETGLRFDRDTLTGGDIISYPTHRRYVNELKLMIENYRVLYPYQAALTLNQGKGFVRMDFTGNYFFNYARGGGLQVRLFAGKFLYTGNKTFLTQYETSPYHLTLSGPKGDEDYTYSNYFIGRNEFEKLYSQQIMNRDGAFKVRTDLLSNKIGKTDNWLTAINFSTSIPNKINPLSILPIKIPLKIFADAGTYAEAWDKNNKDGKLLYDAGLQLSLCNDVLNIYAPLLYSKVYDDYFKSTLGKKRFVKNISFSIDIQKISIHRLFPQIDF